MQHQRNESTTGLPTGIFLRHANGCPGNGGCSCTPTIRAKVYDKRAERRDSSGRRGRYVAKSFPVSEYGSRSKALKAATAWRAKHVAHVHDGGRIAQTHKTLCQVAEEWLAGAKASPPTVLNRSQEPYKPSALRGYEADLKEYALKEFGAHRIADIGRGDLQAWVDRLIGEGHSGSKVRNIVIPLRVLYRHAVEREWVNRNPTIGLRLPNGHNARERAASPSEAARLLAALPAVDRPMWATAFYAGLRRGELRGLRWEDVDLAKGIIQVRRSWDDYAGEVTPKSKKGTRTVPVTALLRDYLTDQKVRTEGEPRHFVFPGKANDHPFTPSHIRKRAAKAWEAANAKRAKDAAEHGQPAPDPLVPIGLHECRHTFVSLMHDAGLSLERIGDYVGHSSTYMTDRYRHLLEGHEDEARRLMDEYLARADTRGRIEQLESEA
jgi:integrase